MDSLKIVRVGQLEKHIKELVNKQFDKSMLKLEDYMIQIVEDAEVGHYCDKDAVHTKKRKIDYVSYDSSDGSDMTIDSTLHALCELEQVLVDLEYVRLFFNLKYVKSCLFYQETGYIRHCR